MRAGNKSVQVVFHTRYNVQSVHHVLCVTGSSPYLGQWHPELAVPLQQEDIAGRWSGEVQIRTGESFEWKLVVIDNHTGHVIRWEERENRYLNILGGNVMFHVFGFWNHHELFANVYGECPESWACPDVRKRYTKRYDGIEAKVTCHTETYPEKQDYVKDMFLRESEGYPVYDTFPESWAFPDMRYRCIINKPDIMGAKVFYHTNPYSERQCNMKEVVLPGSDLSAVRPETPDIGGGDAYGKLFIQKKYKNPMCDSITHGLPITTMMMNENKPLTTEQKTQKTTSMPHNDTQSVQPLDVQYLSKPKPILKGNDTVSQIEKATVNNILIEALIKLCLMDKRQLLTMLRHIVLDTRSIKSMKQRTDPRVRQSDGTENLSPFSGAELKVLSRVLRGYKEELGSFLMKLTVQTGLKWMSKLGGNYDNNDGDVRVLFLARTHAQKIEHTCSCRESKLMARNPVTVHDSSIQNRSPIGCSTPVDDAHNNLVCRYLSQCQGHTRWRIPQLSLEYNDEQTLSPGNQTDTAVSITGIIEASVYEERSTPSSGRSVAMVTVIGLVGIMATSLILRHRL